MSVAGHIKHNIKNLAIKHPDSPTTEFITVSMGISSTIPTDDIMPEQLITAADQALYSAKRAGRNTIKFQPLPLDD